MSTVSTTNVLMQDQTQTVLKSYGRASLFDYFEDMVIYRNLEPLDRRLPGLKAAAYKMEIANDRIPRKQERDYAKATVWFAKQAQKLRKGSIDLRELLFVGDTLYNDGQAYTNMKQIGGWLGSCFICGEKPADAFKIETDPNQIFNTNRWSALGEWVRWTLGQGLRINERTLVIVDIDKTALGAKGRNDEVINQARLEGIYRTMSSVLGDNFDRAAFERQYHELNRARYHTLTEDNQDYLAYICLAVNAGLIAYDEVVEGVKNHSLENFEQFLRWVDSRMMGRATTWESIRQVHEAVIGSVRTGDPTPFKRFRRQEFVATVERMGFMGDNVPVEELLEREITLTNEVCELAEWLRERGCVLLCLSDKPDEASCPDRRQLSDQMPVHKTETHRVGTSIQSVLKSLA